MSCNYATVEACVNLVTVGQLPKAIGELFNTVSAEEIRPTFYAIVGSLISRKVQPETIASFRDMVRGCAYDCGLDDPNVQSKWTDEDHRNVADAIRYVVFSVRATADPCNLTMYGGNTDMSAESARASH